MLRTIHIATQIAAIVPIAVMVSIRDIGWDIEESCPDWRMEPPTAKKYIGKYQSKYCRPDTTSRVIIGLRTQTPR